MHVTVTNPEFTRRSVELRPGDELRFGRHELGVGKLREDTLVSRHHGLISATADGFSVTSIGTYNGFVVADHTTPSKLYIPCGVGPIDVPFGDASIILEYGTTSGKLDVSVADSPKAENWRSQWGPEAENTRAIQPRLGNRSNRFAPKARRTGAKHYVWFNTLVAMCEPTLRGQAPGVPTNAELAAKLNYSKKAIEQHVRSIYLALEVPKTGSRRSVAVELALKRDLVRRVDIE